MCTVPRKGQKSRFLWKENAIEKEFCQKQNVMLKNVDSDAKKTRKSHETIHFSPVSQALFLFYFQIIRFLALFIIYK